MNIMILKKIFAVTAIVLLFLNLLFVGLGLYSQLTFWIILAVIAVLSYAVMKFLK